MAVNSSVNVNDLGRQAYQKILFKDYPSAIDILTKAIRLYPKEKELFNNRSLCYYHLQNYKLALQDSQYLYDHYPNYIKSLFRHAQNKFAIKSYREAESLFQEVLNRQPDCTEANIYLLELKKIKLIMSNKHDVQQKHLDEQELAKLGREFGVEFYFSDTDEFKDEEVKIKEVVSKKKAKAKKN
ncbi:hypothetical protein WDU94_002561 [Cyamophila willieti]